MPPPDGPFAVRSRAPVRVCDVGGWTDTWFARYGRVVSVAVEPAVEVEVRVGPASTGLPPVLLEARGGEAYAVPTGEPWGRHPLLEAAIASVGRPPDVHLRVRVSSEVPPGAGTGTSAAAAVALIGALGALLPERGTALDVARAAQRVETHLLHRQCGIQDQIASALGGICDIAMHDYPRATVTAVPVAEATLGELDRRLVLIYLGGAHDSSALHEQVIRDCAAAGPEHPALVALRRCAGDAALALAAGDLATYGHVLIANTEAQAALHPALIGREASAVIARARASGALGYKVNGAGGDGGSITLLAGPDEGARDRLLDAVREAVEGARAIPIRTSRRGLAVTIP